MKSNFPQIVTEAERLLFQIEKATAKFPRDYRHTLGGDLREDATNAVLLGQEAARASKHPSRQISLLWKMSSLIDRIKLRIDMAERLQCISLEWAGLITEIAGSCGRQCGGWLKQADTTLKGQSPDAHGRQERALTLSTGAASQEAYP